MINDDTTASDQRPQIARLRMFLTWAIPVIAGFGVLEALAFVVLQDARSGATGIAIFGYVATLIVARARLSRGALYTAVSLTWVGILIADLIIVLIQPAIFPTLAVVPLLAVAVALPYTSGPALRRLIVVCWLTIVIVTVFGEVATTDSALPNWFSGPFRVSSLAAAAALVLLLLQQFSVRLTETLAQTQTANSALRQSEERYRSLFENALEGIFRSTPAGRFTDVNPALVRMLGYDSVDEVRALRLPGDLYAEPERRDLLRAQYDGPGVLSNVEIPWKKKDGQHVIVSLSAQAIRDDQGQIGWYEGIVLDITERKRAEEHRIVLERKLLEAQRLESLAAMAGGIAHDFNNLLAVIVGNVELSMLDLPATSATHESCQSILVAAQRAAGLTQQMLAYSGRGSFILQRLDLSALLNEMRDLLHTTLIGATQLHLRLAHDLPPVEADASQIRQLVMNLLINAAEAIGSQPGHITLATGTRYVDRAYLSETYLAPDLAEGEYVFLEIADTGSGIDEATLARIFDPFFTTKFVGRGLGLPATLGVVRGHRGALKVQSAPGRGSTFTVLLPALPTPPMLPTLPMAPAIECGSSMVLVVDDEPGVRTVIQRTLERAGLTVLVAAGGHAAVDLFRAHADDLSCVLLDLTMPEMSGEEVFDAICRIKPGARVILISGYDEREATRRFTGERPAGFLQKPFSPQSLREIVRRIMGDGEPMRKT